MADENKLWSVPYYIKCVQYLLYIAAVGVLLLSTICIYHDCNAPESFTYQEVFRPFFRSISPSIWNVPGIPLFLILQLLLLAGFFGIALYIGLRTLPIPLSNIEKAEISLSPYAAFSKSFFSKVLFGKVMPTSKQTFDLRNTRLDLTADLYLFHSKASNKVYGLALIFILVIFGPYFFVASSRSVYFQLIVNFAILNLSFLGLIEVIFFSFSTYLKGKKNV